MIAVRRFVDLFCGVGGIRLGMESAGFECVFSCDVNKECQLVYQKNFGELPLGDIKAIVAKDVPDHEVLCAGFPCQPFSISGRQLGFDDTRGTLFFDICRILDAKNPPVVLLENVKHLLYHDGGRTLSVILGRLQSLGYVTSYKILNASDFGVPQNRERIIMVGIKNGYTFDFGRLDFMPRPKLSDFLDKQGDFVYLSQDEYTLIPNPVQQPSGLIFAGYRNKVVRKNGVRPDTLNLSRTHKQPNRIYSVHGVHPALMSQEVSGRYFILLEDGRVRRLTLSECWRLMGFPDDFKKSCHVSEQYRQLGNSVCVPMISAIAKRLSKID